MTHHRRRPSDPSRARRGARGAHLVAVLALVVGATSVAPLLAACEPWFRSPAPVDPTPTGTVSHTRPDPAAPDRRVLVTVRDDEGHEWNVRLPLDTACVQDAAYPACAG